MTPRSNNSYDIISSIKCTHYWLSQLQVLFYSYCFVYPLKGPKHYKTDNKIPLIDHINFCSLGNNHKPSHNMLFIVIVNCHFPHSFQTAERENTLQNTPGLHRNRLSLRHIYGGYL